MFKHEDPPSTRQRLVASTLLSLFAILTQVLVPLFPGPKSVSAAEAAHLAEPITMTGAALIATLGERYEYHFDIGGVPPPKVYMETGSLPLGLSLAPDGTISGVPLNGGTYYFSLRARNGVTADAVIPAMLDVVARPPQTVPGKPLRQLNGVADSMVRHPHRVASSLQWILATAPTFDAATTIAGGGAPSHLATADFNADGKLDMAATQGSSTLVSVWLNTTTSGASTPSFSAPTDLTASNGGHRHRGSGYQ